MMQKGLKLVRRILCEGDPKLFQFEVFWFLNRSKLIKQSTDLNN